MMLKVSGIKEKTNNATEKNGDNENLCRELENFKKNRDKFKTDIEVLNLILLQTRDTQINHLQTENKSLTDKVEYLESILDYLNVCIIIFDNLAK